jgi:biopolymer transport protein ExbD
LGIVLPAVSEATAKKVKLKDENLSKIWIDQDGNITLISGGNEQIVPMSELQQTIHDIVKDNPDMVISLKTDRKSKYQYMVKVLDKLQASGAEKISLSTN